MDTSKSAADRWVTAMRFGFRTRNISDERLRYIRQLGVRDIFPTPVKSTDSIAFDEELDAAKDPQRDDPEPEEALVVRPGEIPSVGELEATKARIEEHGLRFTGLHTVFPSLYDKIAFGEEGRDEQIESMKSLIRNLGAADIPILGYQWNLSGVGRTSTRELRGGAEGTAFDLDEYGDIAPLDYTEAEFWENYERFLEAVLPIAEDVGVRMALHPSDPPVVETMDGIPRLFRDVESFKRALETVPSDHHGLKLCLGCFSEMGADVTEVIRHFGERDEIVFVHFRDVAGEMPAFHETFVDEGSFDEREALHVLEEVGFDGVLVADHVPQMEGDTQWGHRARAFTAGYIRALLRSLQDEGSDGW